MRLYDFMDHPNEYFINFLLFAINVCISCYRPVEACLNVDNSRHYTVVFH